MTSLADFPGEKPQGINALRFERNVASFTTREMAWSLVKTRCFFFFFACFLQQAVRTSPLFWSEASEESLPGNSAMVTFLGWWVHVSRTQSKKVTSNQRSGDKKVTAGSSPGGCLLNCHFFLRGITLPETNMARENNPPGKGDSYWNPSFLGANCWFQGVY